MIIQGKDVILKFNLGSGYFPFACGIDCSIQTSAEVVEKSTVGDGYNKKWSYQSLSHVLTLRGANLISDPSDPVSWDIYAQQKNFLELPFAMTFTDGNAQSKTAVGTVLVTSSQLGGNVNDSSTADFEFIVNGPVNVVNGEGDTVDVEIECTVVDVGGDGEITQITLTNSLGATFDLLVSPVEDGNTTTVQVFADVYNVEYTVVTNKAFNLFSSDALPGISRSIGSGTSTVDEDPLIFDFTANRNFTFEIGGV